MSDGVITEARIIVNRISEKIGVRIDEERAARIRRRGYKDGVADDTKRE